MKICHMTTVHPAQDARIFHRMCRPLAAQNHEVVLIAPQSFSAEGRLRPSVFNGAIGRAARLNRSAIALKAALSETFNVYHFHDPELIPAALVLKALRRDSAVIYDVHEDYPSMMLDKYWLPRWTRPSAALGARLANRLAGKFLDGLVAADGGVAEDLKKAGAKNIFLHYNFPALDLFAPANPALARPSCDLVYIGGLSERAGIFVLFDALGILARSGVRPKVRLAGYTDGEAGRVAIETALQRAGLWDRVKFDGRLAHTQVPAWLQQGRIGLVLLQAIPKFMKNIPSKMFEYWACGLPVLASDLPPARQFLIDGDNGYRFSPASASELAERIADLLSHPDECRLLGQNGRRMIESQWNNERQIEGLLGFYARLLETSSRGTVARNVPREQSSVKGLLGDLSER